MGIPINNSYIQPTSTADTLGNTLSSTNVSNATDKELLEVCKSFESYFVEQVYKEMKKTVHSSDEDSEYLKYFGDQLLTKYAEDTTEGNGLGIAQMLYESMKRSNVE